MAIRRTTPAPGVGTHRRTGYALILAYLVTTCLTIWTFATFERSVTDLRAANRLQTTNHAFQFAESSIDACLRRLASGQFANVPQTAFSSGTYWAEVTPSGVLLYTLAGHGQENAVQRNVEVVVRLIPKSVFQYAVFGDRQVNVSGSAIVDSYNSAIAPYNPAAHGQNGNAGTNSTTPGGVNVSGSIAINGQVVVGPNVADPSTVVVATGGSVVITGNPQYVSAPATLGMPSVVVPSSLSCTDLSLSGQNTVVLAPGSYCYNTVTLTGGATLTASGPVKIYLTGQLNVTGNSTLGVQSDPTKLLLFATPASSATLQGTITGTAVFYGGIYGPGATLTVSGNADVYGSIIAKQVDVTGHATIHYDQALGTLTDPVGLYDTNVYSWREL